MPSNYSAILLILMKFLTFPASFIFHNHSNIFFRAAVECLKFKRDVCVLAAVSENAFNVVTQWGR
jgi:hypothetical protein